MTTIFTWSPSLEVVGTTTYRTRKAQFGDGYSQDVADGINNLYDTWPLTFVGHSAYISPIKAFLDATQGFQKFYWTPPLRAQGLFKCTAPTITPHGNDAYSLTVTFTEAF